jgi:hypothetical protein
MPFITKEVTHHMQETKPDGLYEDLEIGDEQVTSNECWAPDDPENIGERVYKDLCLGEEQVTSNECYDVEEK